MYEKKIFLTDIKDANSHNSSMALVAEWAKLVKKYALNDNEELVDNPGNSFNVFLHLSAQGAAKSLFEAQARINEVNESTAILPKSLLHKLSSEDLVGLYGFPSSMKIAFCIEKEDILNKSVENSSDPDLKQLIINKNMKVFLDLYPEFTLPYDIIINAKKIQNSTTNIYALYNMPEISMDGMRGLYKIINPYISTRELRIEGKVYIALFIEVFQIKREYKEFYVSDPFTSDLRIGFDDHLVGVEVFKTDLDKKKVLMKGFIEGSTLIKDSYGFSYDNKRNKQNLNITFSKMLNRSKLNTGEHIEIYTYSTAGIKGNHKFPNLAHQLNSLRILYEQKLDDLRQQQMLNIQCLAFAIDSESSGGKNQLSLEEIRTKIIDKKYSRNILITHNEIIHKANSLGLDARKSRHDIINMYYNASDRILYKDMILSTGTNDFYFDLFGNVDSSGKVDNERYKPPVYNTTNMWMLEPTDTFRYDKNSKRFNLINKDASTNSTYKQYMDYVKSYNESIDTEDVMEACFPFYIKYENSTNPKVEVYDMNINIIDYLNCVEYDEHVSLDKLDITRVKIIRNPYYGVYDGNFSKNDANTYFILFSVYTGENTLTKMKNVDMKYVSFDVYLNSIDGENIYHIDPNEVQILNPNTIDVDKRIDYRCRIISTNHISEGKYLQLINVKNTKKTSTTYSVPIPVDINLKINIVGKFNMGTPCIRYESSKFKLAENLSDSFGFEFDIKTLPTTYEKYNENKSIVYEMDVLRKNPYYGEAHYTGALAEQNNHVFMIKVENGELLHKIVNNKKIYIYDILHKKGDKIFKYKLIDKTKVQFDKNQTYYKQWKNDKITEQLTPENTEYEKIDTSGMIEFDDNINYYIAEQKFLYKSGDLKIFDGNEKEIYNVNINDNLSYHYKAEKTKYVGVIKNIPWINRLYFPSAELYSRMRDAYYDLLNRIAIIRKSLFDGGLIFAELKRTSGNSEKFKVQSLKTNLFQKLDNIALSLKFLVKYRSLDNIEEKNKLIIRSTIKYINSINNTNINTFSVDNMFEIIRDAVSDIEYINILSINHYENGEVQTIFSDPKNIREVLTVSQKIQVTEDGNIDFIPNITIKIVQ